MTNLQIHFNKSNNARTFGITLNPNNHVSHFINIFQYSREESNPLKMGYSVSAFLPGFIYYMTGLYVFIYGLYCFAIGALAALSYDGKSIIFLLLSSILAIAPPFFIIVAILQEIRKNQLER